MPVTVKFDPHVTQPQAQIIPDATKFNDGVMTKEQVAQLESIAPPVDIFWRHVLLENGWENFGAPFYEAGYTIDSQGFVHLRGNIKLGTKNDPAFVLPEGFRPGALTLFSSAPVGGASGIEINSDGTVTPVFDTGSNATVSLDGITFFAVI